MKRVLFVDACVREEESRTRELARAFLDAYEAAHPDDVVETAHLGALRPQPLDRASLALRDGLFGQWDNPVFDMARQFRDADLLVIAAPFWNGTFPAALHAYFEQICVAGLTFLYEENRYKGFCRARECVFLTTRGGFYEAEQGVDGLSELAVPFLKSALTMMGVDRLTAVAAEGLDIEGQDAAALLATAQEKAVRLARGLR